MEVFVALFVFTILLGVTFFMVHNATQTWERVSGDQGAAGQLEKAESWLRRDLHHTGFLALGSGDSLTTLVGKDGDAIWFLSAFDPATGEFIRNDDGTPRWQRNIIYYCVVPSGSTIGPGVDDGGYEVSHPHKVLVRKVVDSGPTTTPTNPLSQETLLADVSSYLERPVNFSFPSGGLGIGDRHRSRHPEFQGPDEPTHGERDPDSPGGKLRRILGVRLRFPLLARSSISVGTAS